MKMDIKNEYNMEDKDLIIDELLKKVEEKKKEVEVIKNPVFKTNMALCFGPERAISTTWNIHALDENTLILFLTKIETYIHTISDTCKKYGIENNYKHHGYDLSEWKDDVLLKLKMVQSQRKLKELKEIENKLSNLMSQEKKDMIEILAIKKLLGI